MHQGIPQVTQLFLFVIGENTFCCPTTQVMTLLAPPTLTRIPFMPDFARGAFDYQGHTASVISLRHKLHFGDEDRSDGVVLLSQINGRIAGFWVDAVDEVVETEQVEWLAMPEGFQDEVFSHAINYQGRTAFYIDLHALWQHQQQTLVAVQRLDPQQLQALEEPSATEAVEPETAAPEAELIEPSVTTEAAEQLPPQQVVETEPVAQHLAEQAESPSEAENLVPEAEVVEPPPEPAADYEFESMAAFEGEEEEPEYRVAAASMTVDDFSEQREPAAAITTSLNDNNLRLEPRKRRERKRGWWLLLLLLLLLPALFFLYKRYLPQRHPPSEAVTNAPPPETSTEAATSPAEPPLIQIQKKPLENPPPNVVQHVVVKGDTLWDISSIYLSDPWRYPELAKDSDIHNPNRIYPGDVVIIYRREEPADKQ